MQSVFTPRSENPGYCSHSQNILDIRKYGHFMYSWRTKDKGSMQFVTKLRLFNAFYAFIVDFFPKN